MDQSASHTEAARMRGRVRKVITSRGFAFIAGDNGVDYFCHFSAFKKTSPRQLRDIQVQDRVEFNAIQPPPPSAQADTPGPRAIEVTYLEE